MANKILLLLTLLIYGIVVSQSFMYIIALKQVQLNMNAGSYMEFRKLIDNQMRMNFKFAIYGALTFNLLLVIWNIRDPGSLLFVMSLLALTVLVIDVIIALKGNIPVNNIINTWTEDNYPSNWAEFRDRWLKFFTYRQIANITGFICLLIAAVFRK